MRLVLALIGVAVLCQSCQVGDVKMEDAVLRVVRGYESSVNKPNADVWLSIWDLEGDDLTILEHDKPQRLGKAYVEQIGKWMESAHPEKRQTWHTNEVFPLGPGFAYTVSLRTEHSKPNEEQESRVSMVMRKIDGKWKIVHCHFSFVPRP